MRKLLSIVVLGTLSLSMPVAGSAHAASKSEQYALVTSSMTTLPASFPVARYQLPASTADGKVRVVSHSSTSAHYIVAITRAIEGDYYVTTYPTPTEARNALRRGIATAHFPPLGKNASGMLVAIPLGNDYWGVSATTSGRTLLEVILLYGTKNDPKAASARSYTLHWLHNVTGALVQLASS